MPSPVGTVVLVAPPRPEAQHFSEASCVVWCRVLVAEIQNVRGCMAGMQSYGKSTQRIIQRNALTLLGRCVESTLLGRARRRVAAGQGGLARFDLRLHHLRAPVYAPHLSVCVCVCVCVCVGESVCVWEGERERERVCGRERGRARWSGAP